MTTKIIIKNDATSNGDLYVGVTNAGISTETSSLTPGEKFERYISTEHKIEITERFPTFVLATEQAKAGALADNLIAAEVVVQDRMWGDANERADASDNQMIHAAQAQLSLTDLLLDGASPPRAVAIALLDHYPQDWDGLRSYGSTVANLAVAAAYIRSEMKRRILLGEDYGRSKRGEPYVTAKPYVSSEEAIAKK